MSQQINLFNPIFLTQKKYFSALTMLQALVLIAVGAALVSAYAGFQLSRLRPEAAAVSAQLNAAKAQLASVSAGQGGRQKDMSLDARVRYLEAEVFALQRVSRMLGQGEESMVEGYSEYMRAFSRQIVDGLWLTSFSIGASGRQLELAGGAVRPELVPAYLSRLSKEPTMRNRAFDTMEMSAPEGDKVSSSIAFQLQSVSVPTVAVQRQGGQ